MDQHYASPEAPSSRPEVASELNNLLQIIAGTSALIENIWEGKPGAEKYFEMLRESVARATDVTKDLVELSGTIDPGSKILLHPEFNRAGPKQPRKAAPKPAAKPRIMVVDDEKMLLILTGELLRDEGYEVVTAQSGFECLDLFRSSGGQFDLVLLDLSMPLMDGQETFQRLRALRPHQAVMLCTGYVNQERLNHMLEEGLAGFMLKPVGSKEFIGKIRAVIEGITVMRGSGIGLGHARAAV